MSYMLSTLGTSLAQMSGKDEVTCRGLLRLAIIDSVEHLRQSPDPYQTTAYLKTMSYRDWHAILDGSGLLQRLTNIGIEDADSIVASLKQVLIEKQSVLTMAAR